MTDRYHKHIGLPADFVHRDDAPCTTSHRHPVIVLDPENPEVMVELVEAYKRLSLLETANAIYGDHVPTWRNVLTEFARPEPPRPKEPTELATVVKDGEGARWILAFGQTSYIGWVLADGQTSDIGKWWSPDRRCWRRWSDLIDPTVVRKGVTDDA